MTMHAMDCSTSTSGSADYLEEIWTPADRRAGRGARWRCVLAARARSRSSSTLRAGAAELPELTPSADLWGGSRAGSRRPWLQLTQPGGANVRRRVGFDAGYAGRHAAALVAVTRASPTRSRSLHGPSTGADIAPAPSARRARDRAGTGRRRATRRAVAECLYCVVGQPARATAREVRNRSERASSGDLLAGDRPACGRSSRGSRSHLDPRTAAIMETNLKVIDDAIAQSKAALAQDPASRFLNNQLNSALGKKLELLAHGGPAAEPHLTIMHRFSTLSVHTRRTHRALGRPASSWSRSPAPPRAIVTASASEKNPRMLSSRVDTTFAFNKNGSVDLTEVSGLTSL